jgi:signal transduction histidine kinase
VEPLSLQNIILALTSLLTLCVVSSVMTAVLVQQKRDRANTWFALFCLSLLLWSLSALVGPLRALRFGLEDTFRLNLLATAVGASAVTFYLFITQFANLTGSLVDILKRAAPVLLVISLIIIWTGNALTVSSDGEGSITPIGLVFLGAAMLYVGYALFLVWNSKDVRAPRLRIPALLLLAAYVTIISSDLSRTPVAILMSTAAAGLMGFAVLRFQWFDPLRSLADELRVTSNDLRQALTDLAAERARSARLAEEVATAGRYKSDFVDKLGHKLRTPLNSIRGYSELLIACVYGDLNEKQLDRLDKIYRNGNELLAVINDMLDLNRMDVGQLVLEMNPFPMRAILKKLTEDVERRRAEKGLTLNIDMPDDLMQVYGDQGRICQVITHLVDNALKYTFEGEVTLRARNVHVDKGLSKDFNLPVIGWLNDGDWVLVEVIDSGIGIEPEEQAKIFEEFYQGNDPRAVEQGGTGLGLSVARRLIELHKGTIWVKSMPGQGSTFHVALRAHRVAQPTTA